MGARKLAYVVYLVDDKGEQHKFGPEDDVPGWAAKAITNPSAWGEGDDGVGNVTVEPPEPPEPEQPDDDDGDDGDPYAGVLKADLEAEVDKRNAERDDEHAIVVGGTGKVADLKAALVADDAAYAGD